MTKRVTRPVVSGTGLQYTQGKDEPPTEDVHERRKTAKALPLTLCLHKLLPVCKVLISTPKARASINIHLSPLR